MTASIAMVGPLLIHLRVESARKRQGTVETRSTRLTWRWRWWRAEGTRLAGPHQRRELRLPDDPSARLRGRLPLCTHRRGDVPPCSTINLS